MLGVDRTRCVLAAWASSAVVASVLTPANAYAHFILNTPAAWETNDVNGGPQKTGPCGDEGGGTPTGTVTAYQSGQTITIKVSPTIPHPGWWRVALIEGASSTQTLTSLPDPGFTASGVVMGQTSCQAAAPVVVSHPVWSPTQHVILDGVTSQNSTAQETFQATLPPDVTCTQQQPCTLQVIMIMDDGHIVPGCYYHHCADISIDAAVVDSGASSSDSGGSSGSGGGARANGGGMPGGGGCLIASGGGAPAVAGMVGLVGFMSLMRRRRRRAQGHV